MNETKQNNKNFDKIYHGTIIIVLIAYTLTVMFDGDNFQLVLGILGWSVYGFYGIFVINKKIKESKKYYDHNQKWDE